MKKFVACVALAGALAMSGTALAGGVSGVGPGNSAAGKGQFPGAEPNCTGTLLSGVRRDETGRPPFTQDEIFMGQEIDKPQATLSIFFVIGAVVGTGTIPGVESCADFLNP